MYDILMNKSHFLVYAKWSIIILFWQFAILSIYLVSNNNLSRIKTHAATNELDDFLKQKERNVIQTKVQKHAGFFKSEKKIVKSQLQSPPIFFCQGKMLNSISKKCQTNNKL